MSYQGNYPPSTPLTSSQIAAGAVQPTNLSTQGPYWDGSGNFGIGTSTPAASLSVTKQTTTLSGTGNAYGLYAYPTSSGVAYIDAVTSSSGNASMGFRTYNNGTYNDAVRIDSSGNVGVGTTSPNTRTQIYKASNSSFTGTSLGALAITDSTATSNYYSSIDFNTSANNALPIARIGMQYTGGGSYLMFGTSNNYGNGITNTAMAIDYSGNLLVGTTSSSYTSRIAVVTSSNAGVTVTQGNSGDYAYKSNAVNNGGAYYHFYFTAGGTFVGQITSTASTTTYATSSDYRLKYDVKPMTSGLATVVALKPVNYKWNIDDSDGEGFLAHELQDVIPLAVTGEKDALNENGSIKPQSVDYSKIVVYLVAAIQELSAKNDALEARLAALEAK